MYCHIDLRIAFFDKFDDIDCHFFLTRTDSSDRSGSIIISSLAAEISASEARALVDVDVAAVALPRVGALAEEPAVWR